MRRVIRIALAPAVLAFALALASPAPAGAQAFFAGSFPLPHGRVAVDVRAPFAPGAFVPPGYVVYFDPVYGYGFQYAHRWIACERYGRRWIVAGSRYRGRDGGRFRRYAPYPYGYSRPYARGDRGWRHERRFRRYDRDDDDR